MKVSKVIEALQKLSPDDEILVLWWEKPFFEFAEEDELVLTDEAWSEISKEFDAWGNAGRDIDEWLTDAVLEHAETKENA